MKSILSILTILVIGIGASALHADEQKKSGEEMNSGIIYGTGHAFAVTAPAGWILDNESGVKQGLYAVFYPEGGSWEKSHVVMYVNTARFYPGDTLESFISDDFERMKSSSPAMVMNSGPAIVTSDKKTATVRYFSGDKWGNYEAVAYLQEETVFVLFALTAHSRELYDGALGAFQNLIKTYAFFSKKVVIQE